MMADGRSRLIKIGLDGVCLLVVAIPILSLKLAGKPYRRGFYCDDESIRYPFKESTVSSGVLHLYGIGIPLITITVVELLRFMRGNGNLRRNYLEFGWILYNELVVFGFGALSSQFLTDIAKYSIGRLRPHFISVCNPFAVNPGLCTNTRNQYDYIESYECSNNDAYRLKDSRLSFMSGHSSFAAYTMIFTAIYMQNRLKCNSLGLLRPLLQILLIYLAIYTGFSRISDYKHHWSDVLIGLIQGTLVAVLTARYVHRTFRPNLCEKVRFDPDRASRCVSEPRAT